MPSSEDKQADGNGRSIGQDAMDDEDNGGNAGEQRQRYQQEKERDECPYQGNRESLEAYCSGENRYRRILFVVFPIHHFPSL